MFLKKSGYSLLIFYSLLLTYPVFSAQTPLSQPPINTQNITIEQNPQEFKSPVPSPISSYIEEIDKTNQNLKQDILLLRNQVDNLSKELNQAKQSKDDSEIKKVIENQWFTILAILSLISLLSFIVYYLIYQKLKKENEKSIYLKVTELSEVAKNDVLKDFKIQEAEHNVETQTIAQLKQEEFENELNEKYTEFSEILTKEKDLQIKEIKEKSDYLINTNINDFTNKITDIFNEKDKEFQEKINNKFPSKSTEEMITKIVQDQGIINTISEKVENTALDKINKKIDELTISLTNKENEILTDIQKAQLANNHFNIGNIYLKDNKLEEAIEEFHLALRTDHNFYGAYINLGKAYEMIGQSENAIDMYNQAISVRPDHYKAYFNLGNLLNSVHKYEDAEFMFKKALELNNTSPKIYNNLGITNQLMNKFNFARDNYLKAIELNNNYADAYFNLAKVETMMGNERGIYQIAENYLKKNNASQETFYSVKDLAYSTVESETESD